MFTRLCLTAALLLVAAPAHAQSLESDVLTAQNAERAAVGAPPLEWDDDLAAGAQTWADHLAEISNLVHSHGAEGENLWMGTAGVYSHDAMVDSWTSEKTNFVDGTFPDISTTGNWADVGHYSQMVWSGTQKVGCATSSNGSWDILVCRYSPPGNVYGEKTYP